MELLNELHPKKSSLCGKEIVYGSESKSKDVRGLKSSKTSKGERLVVLLLLNYMQI